MNNAIRTDMKLEPIYGFDYFLWLLCRPEEKIYTEEGKEISRVEIANTKFGQVKLNLDAGYYYEDRANALKISI